MTAISICPLHLTTRPGGRASHAGSRGGTGNAWEVELTTRGYEGSEDGKRSQLTGSPDGDNTELRRPIHGLSDTTSSKLTKSQPTPTYSDKPWGSPSPDLLVTPYTTSSPAAYSPALHLGVNSVSRPLLRSPRSYRSRSANPRVTLRIPNYH